MNEAEKILREMSNPIIIEAQRITDLYDCQHKIKQIKELCESAMLGCNIGVPADEILAILRGDE